MELIGKNFSVNKDGERVTTLHVADEFNNYYNNSEAGRGCMGRKVESIYVGTLDCDNLKPGMDIEVLYDRAVTTKNGTFQPVKRVVVIE